VIFRSPSGKLAPDQRILADIGTLIHGLLREGTMDQMGEEPAFQFL